MPKLNLLQTEICDDIEVEEFIDVISDNCTQEGSVFLTKDALLDPYRKSGELPSHLVCDAFILHWTYVTQI